MLETREWREFPFPGIPVRISLIFSRSTLRNHYLFLVLVSKHEIDKKIFPFSSRNTRLVKKIPVLVSEIEIFIQISREKRTYYFKKFWENNSLFLKIYVNKQAINVIPENSRENCLNLDSRSRLDVRDWKKKFLFSSRSTRMRERNSRSRLEARDLEKKILVLVSNTRSKESNSRSRLENWKRLLVTHWSDYL